MWQMRSQLRAWNWNWKLKQYDTCLCPYAPSTVNQGSLCESSVW